MKDQSFISARDGFPDKELVHTRTRKHDRQPRSSAAPSSKRRSMLNEVSLAGR
jgi:hypothetical protein